MLGMIECFCNQNSVISQDIVHKLPSSQDPNLCYQIGKIKLTNFINLFSITLKTKNNPFKEIENETVMNLTFIGRPI